MLQRIRNIYGTDAAVGLEDVILPGKLNNTIFVLDRSGKRTAVPFLEQAVSLSLRLERVSIDYRVSNGLISKEVAQAMIGQIDMKSRLFKHVDDRVDLQRNGLSAYLASLQQRATEDPEAQNAAVDKAISEKNAARAVKRLLEQSQPAPVRKKRIGRKLENDATLNEHVPDLNFADLELNS